MRAASRRAPASCAADTGGLAVMRRRPYAELPGVKAPDPAAKFAPPKLAAVLAPNGDPPAGRAPVDPDKLRQYRTEIRDLSGLIAYYRERTDREGQAMCAFAEEKLMAAVRALDRNDDEEAWINLFGAAKLCRTFDIDPRRVEQALLRIKGLLD